MLKIKQIVLIAIAAIAAIVIAFVISKVNPAVGLAIAFLPFVFLAVLFVIQNPFYGLILCFTVDYFILGLYRYVPIQGGIVFDISLFLLLFSLLVNTIYKRVKWSNGLSFATVAALIWMIYCIFELFNPQTVSISAWTSTVRGVSIYLFVVVAFTSITCDDMKKVKSILLIWGAFTLIATAKALMQKYLGFDTYEKIWLYRDGGYTTHIIASGIRYFSFFSDAANFGCTMGHSMVVFACAAFFESKVWKKVFYFIVAAAGLYSLLISGTRAALAVPLFGFTLFILLSRNWKTIVIFTVLLAAAVGLLRFTTIGQGNAIIRRTRSAFFPTEDASFQVRLANQQIFKQYLTDKPFGVGIGHAGKKARKWTNNAFPSTIPTDSWFVMIWVETGIVGLILNLLVMISIIIYSSYLILFKVTNTMIRGYMAALLSGVFGILVASYANEIFGQFPTSMLCYMSIGILMMCRKYDADFTQQQTKVIPDNN